MYYTFDVTVIENNIKLTSLFTNELYLIIFSQFIIYLWTILNLSFAKSLSDIAILFFHIADYYVFNYCISKTDIKHFAECFNNGRNVPYG